MWLRIVQPFIESVTCGIHFWDAHWLFYWAYSYQHWPSRWANPKWCRLSSKMNDTQKLKVNPPYSRLKRIDGNHKFIKFIQSNCMESTMLHWRLRNNYITSRHAHQQNTHDYTSESHKNVEFSMWKWYKQSSIWYFPFIHVRMTKFIQTKTIQLLV